MLIEHKIEKNSLYILVYWLRGKNNAHAWGGGGLLDVMKKREPYSGLQLQVENVISGEHWV